MFSQGAIVLLSVLTAFAQDDLKRWSNDEVTVMRTAAPESGKPLVFAAMHKAEYTRTKCQVYLPSDDGERFDRFVVSDENVSNENGENIDWIEVYNEGQENICGIKILDRNYYHGDYDESQTGIDIDMFFLEGGLFGQTYLKTLTVQVHVIDDLLTNIPENFLPRHYDLTLIPDLMSTEPETHYSGTMQISLENVIPDFANSLMVHMDGLNVRRINVDDTEDGIDQITFDLQKGRVAVFSEGLFMEQGDMTVLEIDFEANIDPELHTHAGLYKEVCSENSDKFCWFTQFESTSARYAFPCIDEPNKKATFDIKVARTEGWNTLSNMPITDTVPIPEWGEGWVMDTFETTPVMPTYLIAFAIQDFAGVEGENNVTIWANKADVDAGLADYSQDIGPRIIEFYGSTFGWQYNLPKMDMVSVPKKGGAMENWGLILYSYDTLMYDQESMDVEKKWRVLEVVAHELAHQWFGNLVTMNWWDQTWLNEGFASYVSHLGAEAIDPDMNSWGRMVTHRMFQVMQDDSSDQSWAMSDSVKSRKDIGRKFGSITYSKGASFIRMMEQILGYPTLVKGLSSYLAELQFSNSVEEDLFFHLEVAGLEDGTWPQGSLDSFDETMKTWTNQAGFPLVDVHKVLDEETGQPALKLTQSWYTDVPMDTTKMWDIPINMVIVGDADTNWDDTAPSVWLSEESTMIPIGEDTSSPIILNKKAMGYFRINYDVENWLRIATTLKTDRHAIHPLNRAQIICDVIALTRTGHVNQEIHDAIMEYIDMETDFAPLRALKECAYED